MPRIPPTTPSRKGKAKPTTPAILLRLGQRITELRQQKDLTQVQLAKLLGINRVSLSNMENGARNVSLLMLEILARGFRMSLSDLLQGL